MSRNLPPALKAHMQNEVTAVTQCLAIERADGRRILLTSHDEPVTYEGEIYKPSPSFTASAIKVSSDLSADNSTIALGLDEEVFITSEFESRLYDDAEFELFAVSWEDPTLGDVHLTKGWVNEITLERGMPKVDIKLRGMTSVLNRSFMEKYSKTCRASLGDDRCRLSLSPYDNLFVGGIEVPTGHWFIEPDVTVPVVLDNPSFEADGAVAAQGAITGWDVPASSSWTVEIGVGGHQSSYSLVNREESPNRISFTKSVTGMGMVAAQADAGKYIVSVAGWAKALSPSGGEIRWSMFFLNSAFETIRVKRSVWQKAGPAYEQIQAASPIVPNVRHVRFQLETRGSNGPADFAIDECTVRYWDLEEANYSSAYKSVKLLSYSFADEQKPINSQFSADGQVGHSGSGITGWTYDAGEWAIKQTVGALSSVFGGYFLYGATGATPSLSQTFDLSPIAAQMANAKTGYFCEFAVVAATDGAGQVKVQITYVDETGATLTTETSQVFNLNSVWTKYLVFSEVPQFAAGGRVRLFAIGADVAIDEAQFYVMSQYISSPDDILLQTTGQVAPTLSGTVGQLTYDAAIVWKTVPVPFEINTVVNVIDGSTFDVGALVGDLYNLGIIEFVSGGNAGLKFSILTVSNDRVQLFSPTPFAVSGNDKFIIYPACDKTISVCAFTYDNAINFRGEPYIPGDVALSEILGA